MQCVATCCSMLQRVAACCSVLLCVYGSECRVWERVCVGVTVVCLWERMLRVSLRFEGGCCVFMAEHVVCV